MLRRVALVRIDVSEDRIASIISLTKLVELGTTLATLRFLVTANVFPSSAILVTLMIDAILSAESSVFSGDPLCHIPEDGIRH
jgi:hypothetical protein